TGEMSSSYFVRFYAGIPYLIGKKTFRDSTSPSKGLTNIENMIVADITLWRGDEKIKTYRGLLLPDHQNHQSVKENAAKWFKLSIGKDYSHITHEVVNEISQFTATETNKSETTMAKSTAKTGLKDAPKETGLAAFEQQAKGINLPEIPKVMTIGGIEFSEALIKKEVDAAKKIVLKSDDDEETYLELVELKKRFVKTRTAPNNFRTKDVMPGINKWIKELKAQTDAYGELAQQGEDHCAKEITRYENWKEAKEREEAERVQKLIDQRTVDLQSVAGVINRDSLHWTFPYL